MNDGTKVNKSKLTKRQLLGVTQLKLGNIVGKSIDSDIPEGMECKMCKFTEVYGASMTHDCKDWLGKIGMKQSGDSVQ